MTVVYDGTNYGGWQNQPNSTSIQSLIEKALFTLYKQDITVIGSGRTDAGVHALGQIAHFTLPLEADLYKLGHSLNGLLPKDIRITNMEQSPLNFHARYDATGKIYHYHLHLDKVLNPFTRLYSWHVPHRVNRQTLQDAAQIFVGTHDFRAFANESHKGAASKNSIRTIQRLDILEEDGGVRLEFEGDGFLYKMVRNITGTLMAVCAGHIDIASLKNLLLTKDRQKTGNTAPPQGLFLMKVFYKEESNSVKELN